MARGGPKALPLALDSNPSEHGLDQAEVLVNVLVEPRRGSDGKVSAFELKACLGLAPFSTLASSGVRALYSRDTDLLIVAGTKVSRVSSLGVETAITGTLPATGVVTIAQNRRSPVDYAICVAGGGFYMLSGNVLTQVTDDDLFDDVNSVCYHGGYFVTTTLSGASQVSEISDGTAWDPLDYDYIQKSPDGLYRVVSRGADIAYFGPKSIEFWVQYAPEIGMPFQFSTSKNQGLLAAGALVQVAYTTATGASDVFVFPATTHEGKYFGVCVLEGYSLSKISNAAVDFLIENEPDPASLTATSWVHNGHGFYCISGTSFSYQFDTYNRKWTNRTSYTPFGQARWRVSQVAAFGQTLVAGHYADTSLYIMRPDALDEDGDPLIWIAQCPRFSVFPGPIETNALYVDAIPGVGLATETDHLANPHIMMQWTEDGLNWSAERWRSLGRQGAGTTDVRWNALGTSRGGRGRIYRLSASAAVVKGVRGASVDAVAIPV